MLLAEIAIYRKYEKLFDLHVLPHLQEETVKARFQLQIDDQAVAGGEVTEDKSQLGTDFQSFQSPLFRSGWLLFVLAKATFEEADMMHMYYLLICVVCKQALAARESMSEKSSYAANELAVVGEINTNQNVKLDLEEHAKVNELLKKFMRQVSGKA